MNNTMKISGVAGTIMLSFSAILKMMHLPLAGILLTLGALCLALIFLPSALIVLRKEVNNPNNRFLFVAAFITGFFFLLGILFRIQNWPGAGLMLTISLVTGLLLFIPSLLLMKIRQKENSAKVPVYITAALALGIYVAGLLFRINHWPLSGLLMSSGAIIILFIVFPWYVWLSWKEESHLTGKFLLMVLGSIAIILPAVLFNIRSENSFDDRFYDQQEQQTALYNYQKERNNVEAMIFKYQVAYMGINVLLRKTADLMAIITEMEIEMVKIAEGDPGNPLQDPPQVFNTGDVTVINYRNLSQPFHPSASDLVMAPGTNLRQKLDDSMTDYRELLAGALGPDNMGIVAPLLEYSSFFPSGHDETGRLALMPALHALTVLKNRLLLAEIISMKILTLPEEEV